MADQENVVIRLSSTANTRGINKMQRGLIGLNATATATQARLRSIGSLNGSAAKLVNKATSAFKNQNNVATKAAGVFSSLAGIFKGFTRFLGKTFKFALLGVLIETAALAAGLASVNLLLKSGAALVRGFNATMTGLSVAAANATASVAALVAIFTQAMRQFAAAQASASYGGSFESASQALRSMQSDSELAVFGLQSLNSAFSAASRNAKITGASIASIRGLSDFAIASGDMEKGIAAAANLVTLLQSGKAAGSDEVLKAATELGPQFEKAFKKATASGKTSSKELLSMFASEELAQQAGIAGTAQNVRGTLMGQLKTFASEFQVLFADIGQAFIGPTQRSFDQISKILRRTIVQISGQLNLFAQGPFQNVIVGGIDRLGTFTARLVNEYLPRTEEVLGKIGAWWKKFSAQTKNFFSRMERFLKRFTEASKEINKFFGGLLKRIGGEFGKSFNQFGSLLTDQSEEFQKFGETLQKLISSIFNFFRQLRDSFFTALPAIQTLSNAIRDLIDRLSGLFNILQKLGPFASLASLLGLIGFGVMGFSGKGRGKKSSGIISRALSSPTALAIGASSIPQFIPGLGGFGDLMTAGMLGGYGGYKAGSGLVNVANKLINTGIGNTRIGMPLTYGLGTTTKARFLGAGAVGATGAVGTKMATNFVEDKLSNTAATVTTGILGGAATGAGVGALLSGPFAGIGAAVGAVLGAVIGGISAWRTSSKAKEQARKAGEQFAGGYADEVTKLIRTGNVREAEKAIADFGKTLEDVSKKVGRSSELRQGGEKEFERQLKKINPGLDMYNRNLRDLVRVTGMAEEELIATAMAVDVDLSSNLLNLQEILAKTGLAVGRFGQDFNNAIYMVLGEAVAAIQQASKVVQAPRVLDEAGKTFAELAGAGNVTTEDRERLLSTFYEQISLIYGRDPLAAARLVQEQIGSAGDPGKQFTTVGSELFGLQDIFFAGGGAEMAKAGLGEISAGLQDLIVGNIVSAVAGQGGTISTSVVQDALKGMGLDELISIAEQVRSGNFLDGTVRSKAGKSFQAFHADYILEQMLGLNKDAIQIQQSDSSKITSAIEGLGIQLDPLTEAITKFNENIDALIAAVGGTKDTRSPRRNLVSTMSKHNNLDMMIAGKRSVTSSLRNVGLGSPSSDHAFGLAYDLTGQNLGMYQAAVRAGGGFAEFHGAGGGRHLHVVPGDAPMGDTATPVLAGRAASATSYSSADSYTINVYPSGDASPSDIAEEVMMRIRREQRSARERN
jgi:hypothetical protein